MTTTLHPSRSTIRAVFLACASCLTCGGSSGPVPNGAAGATSGAVLIEDGAAQSGAVIGGGSGGLSSSSASGQFAPASQAPPDSGGVGTAGGDDAEGQSALTDGAAASGSDASTHDAPVFNGVVNIMVLGSSNESQTCWRAFLWQKLRADGITRFDFVGSQVVGPDCGVPGYDKACEASPGTIVTSLPASTFHGWFAANPPDIVLQHIGGADLMDANVPPTDVIKTYSVIVEQAREVNPKVIFFVAQHTPQDPVGCSNCLAQVMALNALIPGWAVQTTTAESPISVVDLYTGLDLTTDFSDRVHLDTAGSEIVAGRWLTALLPILSP
jgi:acyl-CoA thioesterase I